MPWITACLLVSGIENLTNFGVTPNITTLWNLGFGAVNAQSTVTMGMQGKGAETVIANTLLANLPQLILSFLYFLYNSLFTQMLLADEWNRYAHERKGLRVTSPVRQQRSTYYLHLPYKYGIPLLVMSGLLHWLVSPLYGLEFALFAQ